MLAPLRDRLGNVLATSDAGAAHAALARAGEAFRTVVIAALYEPLFNTELRLFPQSTYEEKQAVAKWVNSTLSALGIAVRCPKTGLPAAVLADKGNDPAIGRFQFEVETGGIKKRTCFPTNLPDHLSLVARRFDRKPGWQAAARLTRPRSTPPS